MRPQTDKMIKRRKTREEQPTRGCLMALCFFCCGCDLPLGSPSSTCETWWHVFPQLVCLVPAPVIGGQVYRLPPFSADELEETKHWLMNKQEELGRTEPRLVPGRGRRENKMNQFLISFVKDEFDLINAIRTKAEFPPWRLWTELEDVKKEIYKRVGWVQDQQQACGSTPKPCCATDKDICKPSESTK